MYMYFSIFSMLIILCTDVWLSLWRNKDICTQWGRRQVFILIMSEMSLLGDKHIKVWVMGGGVCHTVLSCRRVRVFLPRDVPRLRIDTPKTKQLHGKPVVHCSYICSWIKSRMPWKTLKRVCHWVQRSLSLMFKNATQVGLPFFTAFLDVQILHSW